MHSPGTPIEPTAPPARRATRVRRSKPGKGRVADHDPERVAKAQAKRKRKGEKRLRDAGLLVALLLLASTTACNAVERVVNPTHGYWHSEICHDDIYATSAPRDTTPGCRWIFIETR